MPSDPTVFVVDDDPDLCEALQWLLESDHLTVETYTSAQEFLNAYTPERRGVLVLDVRMRGMSGLQLQNYLNDHEFSIPVIILTGHGDVPLAVRAMRAGAIDFLQKPVNDQTLLDCIRESLRLDARNRQQEAEKDAVRERLAGLTPREREVMNLVVSGMSNKQIAHELDLSEKTVEVHRKRVMRKVQVGSVVELVRLVLSLNEHPNRRADAPQTRPT